MICPDCNGDKAIKIFPKLTSSGKVIGDVPCTRCLETGEVPDVQQHWIVAGKALRQQRLDRLETLMVAAAKHKVSPVDLSLAERGIIQPSRIFSDPSLKLPS